MPLFSYIQIFFDFLEIIICVLWRGEYVLESKMEIGELWLLEMSAKLVQTSMDFQFWQQGQFRL